MCSLSLAKFRRVHLQNTFTRPAAIQSSSCGMSLLSWMLISFGRDQVIPIFSFCLWIHTEHRVNFQILQFYQDWLENWLPQCISYYVNKPDSGNEVTDPFISHLGVALFSSFLLVSVISWGYQASSSGNTKLEDTITAVQEFMGKWRWLQCDVHVCWGRSVGLAKVKPCPWPLPTPGAACPSRRLPPSRPRLQCQKRLGKQCPRSPLTKEDPGLRISVFLAPWGNWTSLECSQQDWAPGAHRTVAHTSSILLPSPWVSASCRCLQMN